MRALSPQRPPPPNWPSSLTSGGRRWTGAAWRRRNPCLARIAWCGLQPYCGGVRGRAGSVARAGKRDANDPFAPDYVELLDAESEDPVDPLLDAFERRFPETAKKLDKWLERFGEPQWLGQLTVAQKRFIRASGPVVLGAAMLSLARVAVFNPTCVPSASMQPTLLPGDCVLVEVVTAKLAPPARGEIVVFRPPPASGLAATSTVGEPVEYVKRVVAVGGDTVEILDGKVLINGEARREEVLSRSRQPLKDAATVKPLYSLPQLTVPPGGLFVLGDNRNRSSDSHVWGALSERAVVGKVWFRYSPLGGLGPILSSM